MAGPSGYVVVANAGAGSSERSTIRGVAGRLAEAAPTTLEWSDGDEAFDAVVERLDGRLLVLAGGDGTLHHALNRLDATGGLGRPVAVVPAGTGNDFARGVGIGTDLDAAVEVILTGSPRWYPVIELAGGELAHNNAHFGLGLAAAERGAAWKPRLGRLAYPAGAALEGVRHPGEVLALHIDGQVVHDGPVLAAVVLLGPSAGGGIELVDDVEVADAQLDLVVVEPPGSAAGRLAMAASALRGRLLDRDDVDRRTGREVTVRAPGQLRGDVDGEIREWPSELRLRVRPRGWQVVSPPG